MIQYNKESVNKIVKPFEKWIGKSDIEHNLRYQACHQYVSY